MKTAPLILVCIVAALVGLDVFSTNQSIRQSLSKPTMVMPMPEDSHLYQMGDRLTVLYYSGSGELLLNCQFAPTASNYAEDATCTLAQ
jgi:hypothetical protein